MGEQGRWVRRKSSGWGGLLLPVVDKQVSRDDGGDRLFYDGGCGLCHRAVRFVVRHDQSGDFRFAPLGGETFRRLVSPEVRRDLPDSLVVRTVDGSLLSRSAAVLYILRRLGGGWRLLCKPLSLLPAGLRDIAYDWVARHRFRLFRRPETSCPLVAPEQQSRFEP